MNAVKACSLLVSVSALFAGCSSTPTTPEAAPAPVAAAPAPAPAPAPVEVAQPTKAVTPTTSTAVSVTAVPEYLDPASRLSKERSIYFDFDKFSIRDEFTPLVEAHGKFLAANAGVAIKVEGNADERGSKEYNLALGQKRAESVVRALKSFGVKDGQAEPVSFGEEKPKATGKGEAVWSQNRRVDLAYPTK
jgi:peptidoglycan-associated lipoprotein